MYPLTSNGDILNIIESLESNVHESTGPVIERSSMLSLNFFISSPRRGVVTNIVFKKYESIGKGDFWNFTLLFVFIP